MDPSQSLLTMARIFPSGSFRMKNGPVKTRASTLIRVENDIRVQQPKEGCADP